jgi:uncharacterized damage-inducible protein DinB
MNLEDVRTLYDYNAWANHRALETCAAVPPGEFTRDLASSFPSLRDTLAHIYGAEWVWLERWQGRMPTALPSGVDFPDLETTGRRLAEVDRNLIDYVASLRAGDLERVLEIKTTAGVPFAQPLWQMLQHLANHSTYHRGQVTTLLRQLGAKAVSTDMIVFYRERAAQAKA